MTIKTKKVITILSCLFGGAAVATVVAVPVTTVLERQSFVSIWQIFKESKLWNDSFTNEEIAKLKDVYSENTFVKKGSNEYNSWVANLNK